MAFDTRSSANSATAGRSYWRPPLAFLWHVAAALHTIGVFGSLLEEFGWGIDQIMLGLVPFAL